MLILIMAQGQGKRWRERDGMPKHLAKFCGETIIGHTIRQISELDPDGEHEIIVVGWLTEFLDKVGRARIYEVRPPGADLAHGIRDTAHLWFPSKRVLILLGDVIYSWAVMEDILANDEPLKAWGRIGQNKVTGKSHDERFAIAFGIEQGGLVLRAVDCVVADTACFQALKSIYQHIIGMPHAYNDRADAFYDDIMLTQVHDYTDDFDRYGEYIEAKEAVERAILAEEKERASASKEAAAVP